MCDVQTEQAVRDLVTQMIQDGKAFTAYDITKQLRQQMTVKHYEVRGVIRSMFSNNEFQNLGYDRQLIPTSGGVDAFLYSLEGADIQSYLDAMNDVAPASSPATTATAVAAPPVTVKAGKLTVTQTRSVSDSEGRLGLHYSTMCAAGFQPGTNVSLVATVTGLKLVDFAKNSLKDYMVNADGRVRISRTFLDQNCRSKTGNYKVVASSTGVITIDPV